jgi:RNase H-fold protein (predicted Holliday junction resolvase)
VEFRDERLSTVSAKRLKAAGSKNKKLHHDAMAAAVVLQSYLDEAR